MVTINSEDEESMRHSKVAVVLAMAAIGVAMMSTQVMASVVITQAASAPTYSGNSLNFDEPGSPTGQVATNAWASKGIASLQSGDGAVRYVSDANADFGIDWLGTHNVWYGPWGTQITFSQGLTALSLQDFDSSGPASMFGGGVVVVAYNGNTDVAQLFVNNPAWAGGGNSWFNFTTTGGSTFDRVEFWGQGFPADNYIDNLSWNAVPEPATLALLALSALIVVRRR